MEATIDQLHDGNATVMAAVQSQQQQLLLSGNDSNGAAAAGGGGATAALQTFRGASAGEAADVQVRMRSSIE